MPRIYIKSNTHILEHLGKEGGVSVGINALKNAINKDSEIKPLADQNLSPSEALYGMMGWLTTRDKPITMSGKHDASEVADLTSSYIKANNLEDPADDYYKKLKTPKY